MAQEVRAEVSASECTICMSKPSDYIIIPCGHQCGCNECLTQLKQSGGKCPICRGSINLIQKVYASHNVVIKKQEVKQNDDQWPEDVESDNDDDNKNNDDDDNKILESVRIAPANCVKNNIQNIVIEINPVSSTRRCAVDVCAVLDVSGSMCSSAAVQEDDGSTKVDDGLSRLDLVKHAIKTIIRCLNKNDRLSIVAFSSNASVKYPLNHMTKNGILSAEKALNSLTPTGCTNIWEGLRVGMECLRTKKKEKEENRLSVIMLLTDGQPTIIPPKGEINELIKYVDTNNFLPQINTFGFGYDLNSDLLHNLSIYGGGTFAFIPDSNIVGTTFVHSISNILTTISSETKLYLTPMNGAKFIDIDNNKCWGSHRVNDESWGRIINIGPIMYAAKRYISIPMIIGNNNSNKPYLECIIKHNNNPSQYKVFGIDRKISSDLLAGHLTAKTVSIGLNAMELAIKRKGNKALKLLKTLKDSVQKAANNADKSNTDDFDEMTANDRMIALNKDVNGRLNKSFQGETRFNRWGKHYIRALLRAHQLNLCTNFMDPGLQINGGTLFKKLRAKGDEVFINLPPPKPSRRTGPTKPQYRRSSYNNNNNQQYRQPVQQPKPAPVDMSNYHRGPTGGCFGGECIVKIKGGLSKKICDIKVGDMVQVINGFAKVVFVVELLRDKRRRMISFPDDNGPGLVITGGHPIQRNGLWCLPREQNDAIHIAGCNKVFMFVLEHSHIMIVNGIQCITWGHNINHYVVNHSFFGTDNVIKALQQRDNTDLLKNVIAIYQ